MSSLSERLVRFLSPLLAASTRGKAKRKPARAAAPAAKRRRPAPRRVARPALRPAIKTPAARPKKAAPTAAKRAKAGRPSRALKSIRIEVPPKPAPAPAEPPAPVAAPTGRAILLSPENGKFADSLYPRFRWLSVGGASRYEIAWSEDPNLGGARSILSVATEAVVPVEQPLHPETDYYWRVRGGNSAGWGPWSPAASFRVLEEPPA